MEATDNTECVSKLLRYKLSVPIGYIVDIAIDFKAKYLQKQEEIKRTGVTADTSAAMSKKSASWMSDSIDFFTSAPHIKSYPEERKVTKPVGPEPKVIKNSTLDEIAICIAILKREAAKYEFFDSICLGLNLVRIWTNVYQFFKKLKKN